MSAVENLEGGHTQLMRAALAGDLKTVKMLLKSGADPNERNDEGRTALMFAAINRQNACAKELLRHGADVNVVANDGGTALLMAASEGDTELVKTLLSKAADVSAKFHKTENTALKLAKEHGYDDIARLLQAAGASRQSAERGKNVKAVRQRGVGSSQKLRLGNSARPAASGRSELTQISDTDHERSQSGIKAW
jgi:ankyrin repeat protein